LFADPGGFWQNPERLSELFRDVDGSTINVAERAYILSAAADGPRAYASVAPALRASYENLLLLCQVCHTVI